MKAFGKGKAASFSGHEGAWHHAQIENTLREIVVAEGDARYIEGALDRLVKRVGKYYGERQHEQ